MAQELRKSFGGASFVKGGVNQVIPSKAFTGTVAGSRANRTTQVLSTVDEVVALGELTGTGASVVIFNLDPTNSVLVGSDGTLYPIAIPPLGWLDCFWNAAAIHAKGSAGTPEIEAWLVDA